MRKNKDKILPEILIFSPYYPPHIGGVESYTQELSKYLSEKNISVSVFTPKLPAKSQDREKYSRNLKVLRFPAFEIVKDYPLPKLWRPSFWKLFVNLYKKRIDLVVSQTRFFNTSLWALLYAKTRKKNLLHIEHGSRFVQAGNRMVSLISMLYDHSLGRLVLNNSTKTIAISVAVKEFINKLSPKINCQVIYRGINPKRLTAISPNNKLRNRHKDKIIITYIGRLSEAKGVQDLISAIVHLDNNNYVLFIVGDGPQNKTLRDMTKKKGLKDKIVFFGHKDFEEAMAILKISDIFVNPSYSEGLPTTVIEAGLCCKAVIATDVGGTREIISDNKNGYLIKPQDVKTLHSKLNGIIADKQTREAFGKRLSSDIIKKFDWEKTKNVLLSTINRKN